MSEVATLPNVSFIGAYAQMIGTQRLIDELRSRLSGNDYHEFIFAVAFARTGPLDRLTPELQAWKKTGRRSVGIFGIDNQSTSKQALRLGLELLDEAYATQAAGRTFHPKVYLFWGHQKATMIVGSNNLTVGGTETNFEACTLVEYELPPELCAATRARTDLIDSLLPCACRLTTALDCALITKLDGEGVLLDEVSSKGSETAGTAKGKASSLAKKVKAKPPSPIPSSVAENKEPAAKKAAAAGASAALPIEFTPGGLLMQIKPHDNGEIFLSKLAVDQSPKFFGWPFTGSTTPKRTGNPSYPQRTPDPVVDITVFGKRGSASLQLRDYKLNTVYYQRKSEIRITASPLVTVVPEYSIMIMRVPEEQARIDYDIVIHTPDSPDYATWEVQCNQQMPGGGQKPRKFGWI